MTIDLVTSEEQVTRLLSAPDSAAVTNLLADLFDFNSIKADIQALANAYHSVHISLIQLHTLCESLRSLNLAAYRTRGIIPVASDFDSTSI